MTFGMSLADVVTTSAYVCMVAHLKHIKALTVVTIAIISHKSRDKMSALHTSSVHGPPMNVSFSSSEVPMHIVFLLYIFAISFQLPLPFLT